MTYNQLLSWATDLTNCTTQWNRLALTKKGSFMAAKIFLTTDNTYDATVYTKLPDKDTATANFKTLQDAQAFADKELKRQGFQS